MLAQGPNSLKEHVNYKDFADAYYLRRDGPRKRHQLPSLGRLAGWPGKPDERIPLDGAAKLGVDGITRLAHLPILPTLKATHDIPASTLFKAAEALSDVSKIRSPEAFFAHYDTARTWPFAADYTHPRN